MRTVLGSVRAPFGADGSLQVRGGVRRYRGSAVAWGVIVGSILWQSLPSGIRQGARRTPSWWSRSSHTIALAAAASRGFWHLLPGNLLGSRCVGVHRPIGICRAFCPLLGWAPSVGLGLQCGGTSHGWLLSRRPAIMGKLNSCHKLDTAQITYRVDVCPTENLPYIQPYPITSLSNNPKKLL